MKTMETRLEEEILQLGDKQIQMLEQHAAQTATAQPNANHRKLNWLVSSWTTKHGVFAKEGGVEGDRLHESYQPLTNNLHASIKQLL